VTCGSCIKALFKHDLFSLEDCGCFETKPKGRFILNLTIAMVSFSTLKKNNEI
jgi:hypothetical protein